MNAFFNHPCDRFLCPECVGGQCFGGGCRYNPAPYAAPTGESEEEINEEWMGDGAK